MTIHRTVLRAGSLIVLTIVLMPNALPADSDNTQLWLRYEHRQRINDNTRAFGNIRYEELVDPDQRFGYWRKLAATGGVSYDLSKRIRAEGGLGFYQTWYPDTSDLFEARTWQAITLDWPEISTARAKWVVHHRFMLEERFQKSDSWSFSLRGRYRLAFTVPFNRSTVEPGAFFLPMSAEFFINPQTNDQELFANKSRLTAGLGYVLNKTWTVELRYAWQKQRDTLGADFEANGNIIDLRFKTNVRIRDYLKSR